MIVQPLRSARDAITAVVELERLGAGAPWSDAIVASELSGENRVYIGALQPCSEGAACNLPHIGDELGGLAGRADLIGFAGFAVLVDVAHIMDVVVHPDRQGQGVGRRLLDLLADEAGRHGCGTITLEVREGDTRARRFYASAGFVECGMRRGYYPDGQSAVIASRELLACAGLFHREV